MPFLEINQNGFDIPGTNNNKETYEFWNVIEEQAEQVKLSPCNK